LLGMTKPPVWMNPNRFWLFPSLIIAFKSFLCNGVFPRRRTMASLAARQSGIAPLSRSRKIEVPDYQSGGGGGDAGASPMYTSPLWFWLRKKPPPAFCFWSTMPFVKFSTRAPVGGLVYREPMASVTTAKPMVKNATCLIYIQT
jgi:hypothetical protein